MSKTKSVKVLRIKAGDVVETKSGHVFRVGSVEGPLVFPKGVGSERRTEIAHVLVPRRRVLGYTVREGDARGKGLYYACGGGWNGRQTHRSELLSWSRAVALRDDLSGSCRIVTMVARSR